MLENYKIIYQNGKIEFFPSNEKIVEIAAIPELNENLLRAGWISFSRLGDPELLSCSVYRKKDMAGGVFVMQSLEALFIAKADSNLEFSLACGHFAKLVENVRYASDIWEEMEGSDD